MKRRTALTAHTQVCCVAAARIKQGGPRGLHCEKIRKKRWFAKLYAKFRFRIFLIATPAVLFAGVSKGGFGSGVAFVSAAILALIIEPGEALAIMLPLLMLIDLVTLRPYRGVWNFADAKVLILRGILRIALGALLF